MLLPVGQDANSTRYRPWTVTRTLRWRERRQYSWRMAKELDDIRAQGDCPKCGRELSVSYRTLRLSLTVECQGCGETIHLQDDTPIGAVQRLIDDEDG